MKKETAKGADCFEIRYATCHLHELVQPSGGYDQGRTRFFSARGKQAGPGHVWPSYDELVRRYVHGPEIETVHVHACICALIYMFVHNKLILL